MNNSSSSTNGTLNIVNVPWDISAVIHEYSVLITLQVISPVIAVFGIFTLICTIIILLKRRLKKGITVLMLALSVTDLLALFVSCLFSVFLIVRNFYDFWDTQQLLQRNFYFVNYIIRFPKTLSSTFTVIIGVERLIAILKPNRIKFVLTRNVAIWLSVAVIVTVPLLMFPMAIEFQVVDFYDVKLKKWRLTTVFSSVGSDRDFYEKFYIVYTILFHIAPIIITSACNITLLVYLQRKTQEITMEALHSLNRMRKEIKVTKPVLIVTLVFICCATPSTVVYLLRSFEVWPTKSRISRTLVAYAIMLELVNHAINPSIFYFSSKEFKEDYKNLLRISCRSTKVQPISIIHPVRQSD